MLIFSRAAVATTGEGSAGMNFRNSQPILSASFLANTLTPEVTTAHITAAVCVSQIINSNIGLLAKAGSFLGAVPMPAPSNLDRCDKVSFFIRRLL